MELESYFMKPKLGSKSNFRSDTPCEGVQRA